jgi:hypothetical protein
MPSAAVEWFRSSSLRYERGHSGSASFAARSRGARRRSRSASRRCEGGAHSASTRAAGTRVPDAPLGTAAALRLAHFEIQRRPPDLVERAAPSKCCAFKRHALALRARGRGVKLAHLSWCACAARSPLDIVCEYSYVANRRYQFVNVRSTLQEVRHNVWHASSPFEF